MSPDNVEVVQRSFEAFARGDFELAMAAFDPAVEFDLTRVVPDGQVYDGHAGIWQAMRRWLLAWEDYRMEVDDYLDAGDSVVICFRESGRGKGTGLPVEQNVTGVWKLRAGKVVRVTPYLDRKEALEAAGLRE
jgi:uncharacterized protein